MKKKPKLITETNEWTLPFIEKAWPIIDKLGQKYGWKGYEPQIEIVTYAQMLDNYSSVGMPNMYEHWSFGKSLIENEKDYCHGHMGLAYEMIINSDPAICYLMEDNTACMQLLTMAHAAVGHSHFFKHNYLFKEWTDPKSIIDYLVFAKNYIAECEEKFGAKQVEITLDAAHALQLYGVDKYKKPRKLSKQKIKERESLRQKLIQEDQNVLWKTLPSKDLLNKYITDAQELERDGKSAGVQIANEENILYFLEKNSIWLTDWQREILRIVRKIAQYFYPQRQTKLMNEGFASYVHYTLMTDLNDQGLINDGFYLEFLKSHTSVLNQPGALSRNYSGINPYALGFAIFKDIERICKSPTDEDKQWFPNLIGKNHIEIINDAVANYKDDSFILQFLSPKVMRDFKLFAIEDSLVDRSKQTIIGVHDDEDYEQIRTLLANQYDIGKIIPTIDVWMYDKKIDRQLILKHTVRDLTPLDELARKQTLAHIAFLWGYGVSLLGTNIEGEGLYEDTEYMYSIVKFKLFNNKDADHELLADIFDDIRMMIND
jgi:stage V sporulation protein R